MDIVGLLAGLVSGGVGGNIAGALLKEKSLGLVWNTVIGVVGGGVGNQILGALGVLDGGGMIANIAGSTIGGALLCLLSDYSRSSSNNPKIDPINQADSAKELRWRLV